MSIPQTKAEPRKHVVNLLLCVGSIIFVFLLAFMADRGMGLLESRTAPTGEMNLVFPPNTEEIFPSIEFNMTVRSNALGLREGPVTPKTPGVYRIAVIGDSFTFGWGVEAGQAWPKLLEASLRGQGYAVEILNLGKPGAGIPQYLEIAERAIPVLRPDMVVVALLQGDDLGSAWNYIPPVYIQVGEFMATAFPHITRRLWLRKNDFTVSGVTGGTAPQDIETRRLAFEASAKQWFDNLTPEQRTRFDAMQTEAREATLRGMLNIALAQMAVSAPDFMMNVAQPESGFVRDSQASAQKALEHLRLFANLYGSALAVVTMPHGIYVNRRAMENYAKLGFDTDPALLDTDHADEVFRQVCEALEIPFGTATAAFKARADDPTLYYRIDGHFTEEGNRAYAEAIQPWFEQLLVKR